MHRLEKPAATRREANDNAYLSASPTRTCDYAKPDFKYTEPEVSADRRRRRIRVRKLQVKKATENCFKKLEVTKAKAIEDQEVKVSPFGSAGTVRKGTTSDVLSSMATT